jgi:Zn-dependent peptidase ImmA (M78 family)
MISKRIETCTTNLLRQFSINELPIPIKKLAKEMGLTVRPHDFGPNVSGMLMIDKGKGIIGYNPLESVVRQRFTIAHEIGHYELHRVGNEIFVDNHFKALFRDEKSSSGQDKQEKEANAFASSILMPSDKLAEKIKEMDFDLGDETAMKELAKIFDVSIQAMSFRISDLELF